MSEMIRKTGTSVDRARTEALEAAAALIESRAKAFPTPGEKGATGRTEWMNGFLLGLAEAIRALASHDR